MTVEGLGMAILSIVLFVFALLGLIFHLVVLKNPRRAEKIEQKLATELGIKRKFLPWLEENRMQLHQRLMNSKVYNILVVTFLLILLVFLLQIFKTIPL